jgi:rSAM/selenodomain-associated transferase 1
VNHLGVFARYWQPGEVKTRLAATLGTENAARLYRHFVRMTLRRFAHTGDRRSLSFTPATRQSAFAAIAGGKWTLHVQPEGDLGARMAAWFHWALQDADRAVLIGSDSPSLPQPFVAAAFEALDDDDVVVGPSVDGGYWLIGMRAVAPTLFTDIAWGSDDVLRATEARLTAAGLTWQTLPAWRDIDTEDDLRWLEGQLQSLPDHNNGSRELLAAIRSALVKTHQP